MAKVWCDCTECAYNRKGKCKARNIRLHDDCGDIYCGSFCTAIYGRRLRKWDAARNREAQMRHRDEHAKAVSEKIRKMMLARMKEQLEQKGEAKA